MPISTKPYDGNFTTWSFGNTPGAADGNRWQDDLKFLSSRPYAWAGNSTTALFPSLDSFTVLNWDTSLVETDTSMIVFTSGKTDRIHLPYVGDWTIGVMLRCQYNNTQGAAQIQLLKTFTSGHADILMDMDERLCNATVPHILRINCPMQVVAGDIANGPAVKVQYAQNSGGAATTSADGSPFFQYPKFWARWEGTGSV